MSGLCRARDFYAEAARPSNVKCEGPGRSRGSNDKPPPPRCRKDIANSKQGWRSQRLPLLDDMHLPINPLPVMPEARLNQQPFQTLRFIGGELSRHSVFKERSA